MCLVGWGPAEHLTQSSERTGIENNWFALTGRVVAVKAETDGDLHIALQDATGDKAGIVVCEIPAKQQWCSIRETVFSWTTTRFPFHTSSDRKLKFVREIDALRELACRHRNRVAQILERSRHVRLGLRQGEPCWRPLLFANRSVVFCSHDGTGRSRS